jgi:L-2-hydroxyglutarate oxidase
MKPHDYAIIGSGIIGLATARELLIQSPDSRVVVIEKEPAPAMHQSGRNSGVIHSGIYYRPGSLKAEFCRAGAEAMKEYCIERGVSMRTCGKLIVATRDEEISGLRRLYNNATCNGIAVDWLSREEAMVIEPHVSCVAALHVQSTGVTSYSEVCNALIDDSYHEHYPTLLKDRDSYNTKVSPSSI